MKTISLYIMVIMLFLGLSHELWSEGMFMDGLYYATIANNLANNIGSFWFLHFTNTEFPVFHEHPPLAIGIQSLFFSLFGDSIYIERAYSFSTYIITGILIHYIWKEVMGSKYAQYSWIPLFLWVIMPLNARGCSSNLLENTMNIFVSSSALFAIKHIKTKDIRFIFMSGITLFLAFLSKGFTGMFPLIIFILYSIIFYRYDFLKSISKTLLLIISSIIPLIIIYLFNDAAISSLSIYLNNQVINSISSVSTVDSRFYILEHLGLQLELLKIFTISAILIYIIVNIFKKTNLLSRLVNQKNKILLSFLLLSILYPFNEFDISVISFTKYALLNLIIHLSIINIFFYFIYKKLLINDINKQLPLCFFIISLIIITKIWGEHNVIGKIIYLFSKFKYIWLLLSTILLIFLFFIAKKLHLFSRIKKIQWFILLSIIILTFDWPNIYFSLMKELSIPKLFYSILVFYYFITLRKNKSSESAKHNKWSFLFLILGFSGVLPIMISLKQGSFYIITALPFFSISLAIIIFPMFKALADNLDKKVTAIFALILFVILGPITSTSISLKTPHTIERPLNSLKYQYERIDRDKDILNDIYSILEILPKNTTVNIDFKRQWEIHGYFARFSNISLDKNINNNHDFLLSFEEGWIYDDRKGKYMNNKRKQKLFKTEYKKISQNTNKLHLYRRK